MKLYIKAYAELSEEYFQYFKDKFINDYPIFDSPDFNYEFDILNGEFGLRLLHCDDDVELPYVSCDVSNILAVFEKIPIDYTLDDLEYAYKNILKDAEFVTYLKYLQNYKNLQDFLYDVSDYYSFINNKYNLDIFLNMGLNLTNKQTLWICIKVGIFRISKEVRIVGTEYDKDSIEQKINSTIFSNFNISNFQSLCDISDVYQISVEIHFHSYEQGWRHIDFDHTEKDVEDAVYTLDKDLDKFHCVHKLYLYKEEGRFLFTVVGSREEVEDVEKFIDNDLSEFTGLKIEYNEGRMSLIEQENDIPKLIQEYVKEYM